MSHINVPVCLLEQTLTSHMHTMLHYAFLHSSCAFAPKLFWNYALIQINSVMCICFRFWFNPTLLTIVDTYQMPIEFGDFVVVTDSIKVLKTLQDETHGGWNDEMRKV